VDSVHEDNVTEIYIRLLMSTLSSSKINSVLCVNNRDKWVPVTTAWRVYRLRMEERPPIWRVAENILNKQSQTTDMG